MNEIPHSGPIKLFQRLDTLRPQDLLQLPGMDMMIMSVLISASSMPEILSQGL